MGLQLPSSAIRSDGPARVDGADPSVTLRELRAFGLARQVTRVGAKERLEGELRSIAIDLLGPNESDEFPASCADWVATTTEAAVSRISDSALEALVRAVATLLVSAPPDVARYLDRARARREAGYD